MQDIQAPDRARFAEFVAARRRELGLSRDELASALHKGRETACNVEKGRASIRMLAHYALLAQVLQVSMAELLGEFGYDVNTCSESQHERHS